MALLSDIVAINPESVTKNYPHEVIEYIDIGSVHTGSYEGTKTLKLKDAPSRARRIVKDGDTILATVRPNLRSYLYIKKPAENTIASTGFAVLRAKKELINNRYLYYAVTNQYFTDYLTLNAKGSAYPAVDAGIIGRADIHLPELPNQEKIAGVLGAYDDLIENNSKRIEKLEAMARLLYRHYFELPEADTWNKLPLYESLIVHRGKSYKSSELSNTKGLPFINLKCVNRGGGFRKDGLKLFTGAYKESQRVERGDLVMAVTDMTQERMIVARVARVPVLEGGFGVISMDVVKLEPKEGIAKDYLYAMLRWSRFADEVKNHANGANVLHLLPVRITDYSMPMPPSALQREFSEKVSPIFDLIDNLQLKNDALVKARDLLLPRLMSGEIDA
jgi:type I restriction enzyme S subunit